MNGLELEFSTPSLTGSGTKRVILSFITVNNQEVLSVAGAMKGYSQEKRQM